MLLERGQVLLDRVVDPQVDHVEPGALQHHRHQVLPDVVDVALHGADHDLAHALGTGLRQQRSQDLHAGLHRVRGEQHLRHEQDPVAEVDPDDPHAFHERLVQDTICGPAATEEDVRALDDLGCQAVVEVVVHLLRQLVVRQRR